MRRHQDNIQAVHRHIAAIVLASSDGAEVSQLEALLAPGFVWQTPTANAACGETHSREAYLAMFSHPHLIPWQQRFKQLEMRVTGVIAEGNRVAAECEARGVRNDGITYHNFYHPLWEFDAEGKIAAYRIYHDSQHLAANHAAGNIQVVLALLRSFAENTPEHAHPLLTEDALWTVIHRDADRNHRLEKNAILASIPEIHARLRGFTVAPEQDSVIAQHDRVAMEVRSSVEPMGEHLPHNSSHSLLFGLEHARIRTVREYSGCGPIARSTRTLPFLGSIQ